MKKTLLHLVILSCKRASFLIEKQQGRPLSFFDNAQLKLHLKLCSECFHFQKQSLLITSILKSNHKSHLTEFKLPDEAKNRLKKALDAKMKK